MVPSDYEQLIVFALEWVRRSEVMDGSREMEKKKKKEKKQYYTYLHKSGLKKEGFFFFFFF